MSAADPIRTFLPTIGEEEHAKRKKLAELRNAAAAMIAETDSAEARQLAWLASDTVTECLFAPAAEPALNEIVQFTTRLMICSMQAQRLHHFGAGG